MRYAHGKIDRVWSDQARIDRWTGIELAHLRALAATNPKLAAELGEKLDGRIVIEPAEVEVEELTTGHDVGAFLKVLENRFLARGAHQAARWLHWGLTSSDVVDTANAVAMYLSMYLVGEEVARLRDAISKLPTHELPGRTHGQPASPITLRARFEAVVPLLPHVGYDGRFPVMLSGAVGQHRVFSREQERLAASEIGPAAWPTQLSTQVMSPDWAMDQLARVAKAVVAAEKIATDLRLMAMCGEYLPRRAEVGSSAMPSKLNPYLAERICGLAKLWRGHYSTWLDSRVLWLERDLHHSSVDRVVYPALFGLAGHMLSLVTQLLGDGSWPPVDMSRFEPEIDADILMAEAVQLFDRPRSQTYAMVREALLDDRAENGAQASSDGVRERLGMPWPR